jgi:hypothetical protein
MSWFPDLGTVTMIDSGEHVRAVGWLSAKQPFPVGEVPTEFLGRLQQFASKWGDSVDALGWGVYMGLHCCELCGGSTTSGNFGVPHGDLLFVAPQMISHYIEVHRYRPPAQFVTAVTESPLPGTEEYRAAVAPFRRFHERYLEQRRQERVESAARWAHERGGSEESIAEAGLRFFGGRSPEISECIRQALPGAPSNRPRE